MKSLRVVFLVVTILAPLSIVGCGNGNQSFFDESVTVAPWRVNQGIWREYYLVFKFSKSGSYEVSFSRPLSHEDYGFKSFIPNDFKRVVKDPSQEEELGAGGVHLSRKVIVTIRKNGQETQSHEFDLMSLSINNKINNKDNFGGF